MSTYPKGAHYRRQCSTGGCWWRRPPREPFYRDGTAFECRGNIEAALRSHPEPQPRADAGKIHGNRPVDQQRAAPGASLTPRALRRCMYERRGISVKREKSDARFGMGIPEWEEAPLALRRRQETLRTHSPRYLDSLRQTAGRRTAALVHGARDRLPPPTPPTSTNHTVSRLCKGHGCQKPSFKSKFPCSHREVAASATSWRPLASTVICKHDSASASQSLDHEKSEPGRRAGGPQAFGTDLFAKCSRKTIGNRYER